MKWSFWILLVGFPILSWGQSNSALTQLKGKSIVELRQATSTSIQPSLLSKLWKDNSLKTTNTKAFSFEKATQSAPLIYSYQDLAFFCKLEVQMEKKAKLPIKVRLGEVQYVEQMEGKY